MAKRSQRKNPALIHAPAKPGLSSSFQLPGAWAATWPFWLPRALLIVGLTVLIYWPALRGGLIWDDEWYIGTNSLLHDVTGLGKMWFQLGSWVEYYPIQETVLWLQWQLWGNDTLGYHLTDLVLHIVSALLVWHLLSKFHLRFGWLGGLLFAVHPVQVESVAYICELKNTLSLPFFLLAMTAWIDYEESKTKHDYEKALILFLLAMLCKISMSPFAAVILLFAWWKRGRIAVSDVKACAPFLLIAMVLTVVNLWAGITYEKVGHAVAPVLPLNGILTRIDAIGLNATVYFARCFLPVDNMLVYRQWTLHAHALIQYLPWLVALGLGCVLWKKRHGWGRHVVLGLGFFLLMLAPFLGFMPISYMAFAWVMDHFLYIPIIGLIGLIVAGMETLDAKLPASSRPLTVGMIACLIALMIWISHTFAGLFVSGEVFWAYLVQRNPTVWLAHENLGCRLMELNRYPEAAVQLQEAIPLRPTYADGYYNLGVAFDKLGRPQEAEDQYYKSLSLNPNDSRTYMDLGQMQLHAGNSAAAEALFRKGLAIAPEDVSLSVDLAGILVKSGRIPEAIGIYQSALELNSDSAQLQYNLGATLLQTGNLSEAAEHLETAVTLDPQIAAAHENLGSALAQTGRLPEAIDQFEAAIQIDSGYVIARNNLARALVQAGRIPEAIDQCQKVLQIDPTNAQAQANLVKLQQFEMQQKAPGNP